MAAVVAVAVVAAAALVQAINLPIELVRLPSPVAPYTDATIEVKTLPGAACTIILEGERAASAKEPCD